MPRIRIQNIGPIIDTGEIDLTRITVFIGQQSTGKSTIMKILCFCCWVEKYCVTHNNDKWFKSYQHFYKALKSFHHFQDSFFTPHQSKIIYHGEWITITFDYISNKTNAEIIVPDRVAFDNAYNTKLCFIPSERNLISSVRNVDAAYKVKSIDNIFNYILEWDSVKRSYNREHALHIDFLRGINFFYDSKNSRETLRLSTGKEITPYYASSGVQSAYSLYVMLDYLTNKVFEQNASFSRNDINRVLLEILQEDKIVSEKHLIEKRQQVESRLARRTQYKASRVFIEEPEQNLYPTAQVDLMRDIVRMVNHATNQTGRDSSVCITTHSPYIISILNVLLRAYAAYSTNNTRTAQILQTDEILSPNGITCYFINENGTVSSLIHKEDGVSSIDAADTLDGVSEQLDEWSYKLNEILANWDECE